jgi:phosphonate transport system substrate-binding protein
MKNKLILFILLAGAIIGGSLLAIYKINYDKTAKNVINLDKLYPLPSIVKSPALTYPRKQLNPRNPLNPQKTFKLAIASMMSPVANINAYEPFAKYLRLALHMPVKIIQKRTYLAVNNLLINNKIDLAFICTGAYVYGGLKNRVKIIAVPVINGKKTYRAYIIAHKPSKIKFVKDLKGGVFAFTEPLSNTGYEYPMRFFKNNGINPEIYFKRVMFTYNHTDSIKAVAVGIADGASVDSIVYFYTYNKYKSVRLHTKIILKSPLFPIPPIVMSDGADKRLRDEVKKILLDMSKNPKGKLILKKLGIDGFAAPDLNRYK